MSPESDELGLSRSIAVFAPIARLQDAVVEDELLHHGGLMAGATVIAGGLNYAYQVYMGRALGPEAYAIFGSLFALFYLIAVLGRGIQLSGARVAAAMVDPARFAAFHRGFLGRAIAVGVGAALALLVLAPTIAGFLAIEDVGLVIVVATILPFALSFPANLGVLQGRQRFVGMGGSRVLHAAAKLGLGIVLVSAGLGVYGAFGAVAVATFVVLVVSTLLVRWDLPTPTPAKIEPGRTYRYVLPAVLVGFCLTVPANVDVILAKHFFDAREAGLYTAASVFGKVLIFLPLGIITALFPKVTVGEAANTEQLEGLFDRATLYAGSVAGAGALTYWLAAEPLLRIVYGAAYVSAASLVRWYGVAVLAFVLALVALYYELARDRREYVYGFAGVSVVEIALIWMLHPSMIGMVQLLAAANAVLFVIGIWAVKLR